MSDPIVSEEDITAVAELGRQGIRLYAVPVHAVYYVLAKSPASALRCVSGDSVPYQIVVEDVGEPVDDVPGTVASGKWEGAEPLVDGSVFKVRAAIPNLTVDQWGAAYAELTRRAVK